MAYLSLFCLYFLSFFLLFIPGIGVAVIIQFFGFGGKMKRMKRINHHCVFVGCFFADAFFIFAWMRAVRNAAGMLCNAGCFNSFTAHTFTFNIVKYFV